MAWESRGGKRTYYRYKRSGDTVRKISYGSGERARRAAEEDSAARARQEADRNLLAELQMKLTAVDQLAADAQHGTDLLTEAVLLAVGCHKHRGEWRLRR
jgi:hypothetical protein